MTNVFDVIDPPDGKTKGVARSPLPQPGENISAPIPAQRLDVEPKTSGVAGNVFDQFDAPQPGNVFDQFDPTKRANIFDQIEKTGEVPQPKKLYEVYQDLQKRIPGFDAMPDHDKARWLGLGGKADTAAGLSEAMKTGTLKSYGNLVATGAVSPVSQAVRFGESMNLSGAGSMLAKKFTGESIGEFLSRGVQTVAREDVRPDVAESYTGKLAQGVGSMVPFVATGGAGGMAGLGTRGVAGLTATFGGAVGGGQAIESIEEARRQGQDIGTKEEALRILGGIGLGTTEAVPVSRALTRLDRGTGGLFGKYLKNKVGRPLVDAIMGAAEEAIQETFQSGGEAALDEALLGIENDWKEAAKEGASVGGPVGFLLSLVTGSLRVRGVGRALKEAGYTQEQIRSMTPAQQDEVLEGLSAPKDYTVPREPPQVAPLVTAEEGTPAATEQAQRTGGVLSPEQRAEAITRFTQESGQEVRSVDPNEYSETETFVAQEMQKAGRDVTFVEASTPLDRPGWADPGNPRHIVVERGNELVPVFGVALHEAIGHSAAQTDPDLWTALRDTLRQEAPGVHRESAESYQAQTGQELTPEQRDEESVAVAAQDLASLVLGGNDADLRRMTQAVPAEHQQTIFGTILEAIERFLQRIGLMEQGLTSGQKRTADTEQNVNRLRESARTAIRIRETLTELQRRQEVAAEDARVEEEVAATRPPLDIGIQPDSYLADRTPVFEGEDAQRRAEAYARMRLASVPSGMLEASAVPIMDSGLFAVIEQKLTPGKPDIPEAPETPAEPAQPQERPGRGEPVLQPEAFREGYYGPETQAGGLAPAEVFGRPDEVVRSDTPPITPKPLPEGKLTPQAPPAPIAPESAKTPPPVKPEEKAGVAVPEKAMAVPEEGTEAATPQSEQERLKPFADPGAGTREELIEAARQTTHVSVRAMKRANELRSHIVEGALRLSGGKDSLGKKLTATQMNAVERSIRKSMGRLSELYANEVKSAAAASTPPQPEPVKHRVEEGGKKDEGAAAPVDIEQTKQQVFDAVRADTRSRRPEVFEKFQFKGTDGKWYSPLGVPLGVKLTDEKRSAGFSFRKGGTTSGPGNLRTREAAEAFLDKNEEAAVEDMRKALEDATPEEVSRQVDYWLKRTQPSPEPAPAATKRRKPKRQAAPLGSTNDARLRELRQRAKTGRGMTAGNEVSLRLLEAEAAADPTKWSAGDGVGYYAGSAGRARGKALGEQINRGFRVMKVNPDTKMVLVRQVADTGITVSGDEERLGDEWIHAAYLVRDRKYDVRKPVPATKPRQKRTSAAKSTPRTSDPITLTPRPSGKQFILGNVAESLEETIRGVGAKRFKGEWIIARSNLDKLREKVQVKEAKAEQEASTPRFELLDEKGNVVSQHLSESAAKSALSRSGNPKYRIRRIAEGGKFATRREPDKALKAVLKEFPKGAAFQIGSVDPATPTALGTARSFLRRNLTSSGDLPKKAFVQKIARDGWLNSQMRQTTYTLREFRRASRKAYGKQPTEEQASLIDQVLKGKASENRLPVEIREVVSRMRKEIDQLSRHMIDSGVIEGDLVATVESNLGVYATRSYRVFDDPKWAGKVPEDVRNKAKALLRAEYPDMDEAHVNGMIEAMLYEAKAAESPIALLKQSKLGSKDMSILKRRKGIAPEIRALWGEYKDPRVNYTRSVAKMAALIANHQFLGEVKRSGVGVWLHDRPVVKDGIAFKTRIAADQSKVMFPLSGLYTTPEIKTAFEEATEAQSLPDWLRYYMMANGAVKYTKTIGSLMTHVRNVVGNTGFAVANGHWNVFRGFKAFKAVMADLGALNDAEWRAHYRELQELGVVHESARAGELRDVIRDAADGDLDQFTGNYAQRMAKKVFRATTTLYRAEDDIWKVYGFANEYARYRRALPNEPETEVKKRAADIIRNTYPTYSLVPRGVKMIRRFPLVGTFVSFPAEVIRSAGNTLRLTTQELADPKLRHIGAQRLVGMMLAATATGAIAAASRFLMGISNEDDEDIRQFVAPWSKNSQIVYVGQTEDGKLLWVDLSYTDPYEYIKKPLTAFLRGEKWEDKIIEAGREALEPFLSEEILASKIIDVARNTTQTGGQVYNPQGSWTGVATDIVRHVGDAFEPGTVSSARRIYRGLTGHVSPYGKSYDPAIESLAVFTGHRLQELDVPQSLMFRAREFNSKMRDATRVLSSVASRRGRVSDSDLRDAFEEMERSRKELFDDMVSSVDAAIRLGMARKQVMQMLVSAGVPRRDAALILRGMYQPYRVHTSQFLQNATQRAIQAVPREKRQDTAREYLRRRKILLEEMRKQISEEKRKRKAA